MAPEIMNFMMAI